MKKNRPSDDVLAQGFYFLEAVQRLFLGTINSKSNIYWLS